MSKLILVSEGLFNGEEDIFPSLTKLTSEIFDEFSDVNVKEIVKTGLHYKELNLVDCPEFVFNYEEGILNCANTIVVFLEKYTRYVIDNKYADRNDCAKFLKSINIYMKLLVTILKKFSFVENIKYNSIVDYRNQDCEYVSIAMNIKE